MAEHETLWGRDIDETPADLENDHVSNGHHDPITEPIPVVEADYDVQYVPDDEPNGYHHGQSEYFDEQDGYDQEQSGFREEQSDVARRSGGRSPTRDPSSTAVPAPPPAPLRSSPPLNRGTARGAGWSS